MPGAPYSVRGSTLTWNFETSFLVFLLMVFFAQAIAVRLKSMLPMPLLLGIFCAIGFHSGVFPADMMVLANMIAVGTIAFNVLVVHSGTMLDKSLFKRWQDTLTVLVPSLLLIPICLLVLTPLFGRDIAFLAPGSALGGGAACAISSRWVSDKNPAVSAFPWMLFMFQGVFCIPILRFALKKEAHRLLGALRSEGNAAPLQASTTMPTPQVPDKELTLLGRIPADYKTTAYYLGTVMAVSVLNKFLLSLLPSNWNINLNVTALLLGFLFARLGLMEKAPLFASDSYGLLLLGLMGLFANTIARTPLASLLNLILPVLVTLAISTIVLVIGAVLAARIGKFSVWRGLILTMNTMMGFPVNKELIAEATQIADTPAEKGYLASQFGPALGIGTVLVSNALSIVTASIFVNLI